MGTRQFEGGGKCARKAGKGDWKQVSTMVASERIRLTMIDIRDFQLTQSAGREVKAILEALGLPQVHWL